MNPAPCRVCLRFAASYCSFRHFARFTLPWKKRHNLAFVSSSHPLRRERSGVRIPSRLPRILGQNRSPRFAGLIGAGFLIQVLHIIVFVEMLDHVDNEGARTIAYLLIWTCVLMALIMVMTMTVGLSEYRKHLLGSQAELN